MSETARAAEPPRRSSKPAAWAQRSKGKAAAAVDPASATVLFAAALATVWLVLCPLILWAVSGAPFGSDAPRQLQDAVLGEQVALYAGLAMSVLLARGAIELQCAQLSAAANGQEAPHPRTPSKRMRKHRQGQRETARRGGESTPASSHQEEESPTSWVPDMTDFQRWNEEARARQQERITRMRAAVRELNTPHAGRDALDGARPGEERRSPS